ncbi:hypothetical protein WN51_02241 [Melipona quadrifasciata]|uniref:Uncharacterized protein n=1 Tax=Melipona quadrifasciata TaxID=166423 RepID=A0A0M8ZTU7_9HYME|nr:hypothetical protein WN51_02241 [Melipona quadrifasciata]
MLTKYRQFFVKILENTFRSSYSQDTDLDLKKRGSHTCDMQALQPLPVPTTTTTNTAPAMTTSGGQPPLPVSETA